MAADVRTVRKVFPERCQLEQESQTNVPCPVIGCTKIFRQPSALRFHLVKLHRLIMNESDACLAQQEKSDKRMQSQFYCPESGCKFSGQQEKFFHSFKKLKQHYMRVHGQRAFHCVICSERFGLCYDLARHVTRCRQIPRCLSCMTCMESKESLIQHCRETGHTGMYDLERLEGKGHEPELPSQCSRTGLEGSVDEEATGNQTELPNSSSLCLENVLPIHVTCKSEKTATPVIFHTTGTHATTAKSEFSKTIAEVKISPVASFGCSSRVNNQETSLPGKVESKQSSVPATFSNADPALRKRERNIAPKLVLPTPDFMVIPTQTGAMLFYRTSQAPPNSTLKRLAPKPVNPELAEGRAVEIPLGDVDYWANESTGLEPVKKPSVSSSCQTIQTRSWKIKAAETQTTEEYVSRKMPSTRNSNKSCGSQVSPRARVKRLNCNVKSIQTQTSRTVEKRRKLLSKERESAALVHTQPNNNTSCGDWSDFIHNETQTMSFLHDFGFLENSSTQTLESYLFDSLTSESCIDMCNKVTPSLADTYPTISSETHDLLSSVVIPQTENMQKEVLGSDNSSQNILPGYDLFTSEFSSIMSSNTSEENCENYLFPRDFFSPSATSLTDQDVEQKTFCVETQTAQHNLLTDFLTAASQTNDFDDVMNNETQTVDDDFITQFLSHMETQTTDDFLTEFSFSDIETQTTWMFGEDPQPQSMDPTLAHRNTSSMDMETQTCFQ